MKNFKNPYDKMLKISRLSQLDSLNEINEKELKRLEKRLNDNSELIDYERKNLEMQIAELLINREKYQTLIAFFEEIDQRIKKYDQSYLESKKDLNDYLS